MLRASIVQWAVRRPDAQGLSEAVPRLVELGLAMTSSERQTTARASVLAAKAKDLASKTIDRLVDPAGPEEEKANRKRRLLKGPEEFRDARIDRPELK